MKQQMKAIILAVAISVSVPLAGCTTLGNWYVSVTSPFKNQAKTVYQAELAYQTAARLAKAYLDSGQATKEQALLIEDTDNSIYPLLVAARDAEKSGNSAIAAATLKALNAGIAALTAATPPPAPAPSPSPGASLLTIPVLALRGSN